MRFLQTPSPHCAMSSSIRDVTVPPNEVLPFFKVNQTELYLDIIPISIIVYDSREFSLQSLLNCLLKLHKSVHWIPRYVKPSLCDSIVTVHGCQIKYFWVSWAGALA